MESKILDAVPEIIEGVVSSYDCLCIPEDCTAAEVIKAYKRQSVRWHPDKNPDNKVVAEKRFKEVNEAYLTLVDPASGELRKQSEQQSVAHQGTLREGMHKSQLTFSLTLTIDELFRGCTKRKELTRNKVVFGDLVPENKVLEIAVESGWRTGTKLFYPDLGGPVGVGGQSVDIIYEVQQAAHDEYRRAGDDLNHVCTLDGTNRPVRLSRLSSTPLGTPTGPLVPYCNILSELCPASITLLKPHPIPEGILEGMLGCGQVSGKAVPKWATPKGKGLKMRDKDSTVGRVRMPGALQAAVGVAGEGDSVLCSVAWKVTKKTQEVAVGLAPPTAHCDRRHYADVAQGRWGVVWRADGKVFTLGSERVKLTLAPYDTSDKCQITVHPTDGHILFFKNGTLLHHEGKKIIIPTEDKTAGDVVTIEGEGMPVMRKGKVVGRGDVLVTFSAPRVQKPRQREAAADENIEGSFASMQLWLTDRGHPEPTVDMQEWSSDTGTGRQYQARLSLVQKRPFKPEGAFDGQPFMGKMSPVRALALDSVGAKVLRCLSRLADRFPSSHVPTAKPVKRKAAEMDSPAEETPAAKVQRTEEVGKVEQKEAEITVPTSALDDID